MADCRLSYTKDDQICSVELVRRWECELATYFEDAACIAECMQTRLMLYNSLSATGSRPSKVINSSNDEYALRIVKYWLHELDEDWITIHQDGKWVYWVRKSKYDKLPEKFRRGLKNTWGILRDITAFI